MTSSLAKILSQQHIFDIIGYNESVREFGLLKHTFDRIQGRTLYIQQEPWHDFLSMNYIHLQHLPSVHEKISQTLQEWGIGYTAPTICAKPSLLPETEKLLAELVGAEAALLFPSTSHATNSAIPLIANDCALFSDPALYYISKEASEIAQQRGASFHTFRRDDLKQLRALLETQRERTSRMILCDGFYPGEAKFAPIPEFLPLLEEFDAFLYVDDAHSIGLFGASPDETQPLGYGGGGTLAHLGIVSDRILYVASLSKSFGLPLAFLAGPQKAIHYLRILSSHLSHTSPPSFLHLAAAHAMLLEHKEQGDAMRALLLQRLRSFRKKLQHIPFASPVHTPIQTIRLVGEGAEKVAKTFKTQKILVVFQHCPDDFPQGSTLRLVFSSLHTQADIDLLANHLSKLFAQPHLRKLLHTS